MLTRLKVKGFKNLADVDVSFGPFTCVAGANGVGKSNLFDAITFLGALADQPLMDAAKCVRDEAGRSTDVRSLFLSAGDQNVDEISFEAEMLVPAEGSDDLGQAAKAAITFLKYSLSLRYHSANGGPAAERLEIIKEELVHINIGEAPSHLRFPHNLKWRRSVVHGRRFGKKFLSTEEKDGERIIKLHQDGGAGRPRELLAKNLPRTVLSSTFAVESPTALLARLEMRSWRLLQLEPTALRASDPFNAPTRIGKDGSHLAATLYHLAASEEACRTSPNGGASVYARVANRLSELVNDVRAVIVDKDERRELLTMQVLDRGRRRHAARALSDGTLRFLALAILELDSEATGVLCFEEPENGIHPARIPVMLRLLRDLAVDTEDEVGAENSMRQVIVNTHSPAVVADVNDEDLLLAEPHEIVLRGNRTNAVRFAWLSDTWRERAWPDISPISRGELGAYLNPFSTPSDWGFGSKRRVVDREDVQLFLPASNDQ